MIEIRGDLFNQTADAICITTNGYVKNNGRCVVGRGCAKAADSKWSNFSLELGKNIQTLGNVPSVVLDQNNERPYSVLSFPVKPDYVTVENNCKNIVGHTQKHVRPGQRYYGWAAKADLKLIIRSAYALKELADLLNYKKIVLPRPGCGAGELHWDVVGPKLHRVLDNRFFSITF